VAHGTAHEAAKQQQPSDPLSWLQRLQFLVPAVAHNVISTVLRVLVEFTAHAQLGGQPQIATSAWIRRLRLNRDQIDFAKDGAGGQCEGAANSNLKLGDRRTHTL
jgi:hypothetical protein